MLTRKKFYLLYFYLFIKDWPIASKKITSKWTSVFRKIFAWFFNLLIFFSSINLYTSYHQFFFFPFLPSPKIYKFDFVFYFFKKGILRLNNLFNFFLLVSTEYLKKIAINKYEVDLIIRFKIFSNYI